MANSKLFRRVKGSASHPLAPYRDEATRAHNTNQRALRVTLRDLPMLETSPGPKPRFVSSSCRCHLS